MYITNDIQVAKIAQDAGVDRIFIDLETIGKAERQAGYDSVKSHHTIADIAKIKSVLSRSQLLVRVNPIHDGSEQEIESVIKNGADIVMLPMYKTQKDINIFLKFVNKRAKTMLLLETKEAVNILDTTLQIPGIDEIHIGLNDLHLSYQKKFMFELLADGTVDKICNKIKTKNISFGFGGVAAVGTGTLPAELILSEHYRLASQIVILSRSFCDVEKIKDLGAIKIIFNKGIKEIRDYETMLQGFSKKDFLDNRIKLKEIVQEIVKNK
jgi:2-keto-3-deoxy-L-rhamnonate aldolase RhmA